MQADYEALYHRVEDRHWWFTGRREVVRRLVEAAHPARTGRILDVGCAAGALLADLHGAGYRDLTGIDVSAVAIERCRQSGLADARLMDAADPAFPPASFDVVVASDVLEHLADAPAALRAWRRLLRPNGVIIAFVPAFMFLWSKHDVANHHHRRYRAPELGALLASAGLEVERLGYWNFLLFAPAALVRLGERLAPALRDMDSDIRLPAAPVNAALRAILRGENALTAAGANWPLGLSAMAVARVPAR